MEFTREQLQMVFASVPGQALLLQMEENRFKGLLYAPMIPRAVGLTAAEYEQYYRQDILQSLLPQDRQAAAATLQRMIAEKGTAEHTFRVQHRTLGVIWIKGDAKWLGTYEGRDILLLVCHNVSADLELPSLLLNNTSRKVYLVEKGTYDLLYANNSVLNGQTASSYAGKTCYAFVRGYNQPCPYCPLEAGQGDTAFNTECHDQERKCYYHVQCRPLLIFGKDAYALFVDDITALKTKQKALEVKQQRLQELLDNIPEGIRVFEKIRGQIVCVNANQYYANMLGVPKEELIGEGFAKVEERLHPDDRARHRLETVTNLDAKRAISGTYRFYNARKGAYDWINLQAQLVESGKGRSLAYFRYTDVAALKEAELAAKNSQEMLEQAVRAANLVVWEYYIQEHKVVMGSKANLPASESGQMVYNVPQSLTEYINPQDLPGFLDMYARVERGEQAHCEIWHKFAAGQEPRCDRITYAVIQWRDGKPYKAYGIGQDITAYKSEELFYKQTMQEMLSVNPSLLWSYHVNLTKNSCRAERVRQNLPELQLQPQSADQVLEQLVRLVNCPETRSSLRSSLNRKQLIAAFHQGKRRFKQEYCCLLAGNKERWVNTYINLLQNPVTADIEATLVTVDVEERVTEVLTMEHLVEEEYDSIGFIEVATRQVRFTHQKKNLTAKYCEQSNEYEQVMEKAAMYLVSKGDRALFLKETRFANLLARIEKERLVNVVATFKVGDKYYRKYLRFRYLDQRRQLILFSVSDITAAFLKEQQNAQSLQVALTAAKQASAAKSNFLSRMSHEIRTPMNAIIGMDALAAQALGNDERVADCISKIGLSARYLLSLINDILDMSRIESGKMLLKNDKFFFKDFISGINNIIYNQTVSKGLDYECTVANEVDEAFTGDVMKLQQILINLLGNAVKFTKQGKISLDVQLLSRRKRQAKLRFVVNDTGCGIREAFLEKIFEPFEQEDSSTTSVFSGTGLGLAITKNLVDLMGGTIKVRSIVGIGSEFTVDIPMTVEEEAGAEVMPVAYHFEKLHALVVDDDIIICEQAVSLLKDIGMSSEWVASGREAVEQVRIKQGQSYYYDYILIDWKMPDMDGIETTRRIRRLVGPEVTIIIISAYDWETIESDAKAAGANLLITKPLFKSSLISAFQRAKGQAQARCSTPLVFDFTGKRALVAEDNSINAEIARRLLESKHFTVDLAPTGLKALELFVQKPVGYYDVILMDVRMPLMDGLQATANIRHWDKEDAKTIPIVAMTANAFDEDVEKSKAAGMNAHLSKPIEPEILFRTLQHVLRVQEE